MQITLTQEIEDLIDEEMQTGKYFSPNEVLREGLLSLRLERISRAERKENLRRDVLKGVEAMREGKYRSYDSADEMVEEIIAESRAEFEAGKKEWQIDSNLPNLPEMT